MWEVLLAPEEDFNGGDTLRSSSVRGVPQEDAVLRKHPSGTRAGTHLQTNKANGFDDVFVVDNDVLCQTSIPIRQIHRHCPSSLGKVRRSHSLYEIDAWTIKSTFLRYLAEEISVAADSSKRALDWPNVCFCVVSRKWIQIDLEFLHVRQHSEQWWRSSKDTWCRSWQEVMLFHFNAIAAARPITWKKVRHRRRMRVCTRALWATQTNVVWLDCWLLPMVSRKTDNWVEEDK